MGIFNDNGGDSTNQHVCPDVSFGDDASVAFVGDYTFYEFNMILSGCCTGVTWIIVFLLMYSHVMHMRIPNEQFKILRICTILPTYSILSFLSICYPTASVYLEPWQGFFESIALGSFFLLMIEFIDPGYINKYQSSSTNIQQSHKRKWILVFQYVIVAPIAAIATAITQAMGIYCENSSKPYFAHIWIKVISSVSLIMCVTAIINFYRANKELLKGHHVLLKLLSFKLLIALSLVESLIFTGLASTNVLTTSEILSYADVNVGIPAMIICIQTTLFAVLFSYAYRPTSYYQPLKEHLMNPNYETGYDHVIQSNIPPNSNISHARAWFAVIDLREIITAVKLMFTTRRRTNSNTGFEPLRDMQT